jgi:hypothetical protein
MALMVGTAGRVVGIGKTFGFVPPSTDLFVNVINGYRTPVP